jgi:DNA-binding IclR family transcriptional regulator
MQKDSDDEIRSVTRSAKILESLSMGKTTLTEIANYCHFTKPTVFRLLKALEIAGLARKDPFAKKHYLGYLIEKINTYSQITHKTLIMCAIEEMKRISDDSGETVNLGVRLGLSFMPLHEIHSKHGLRVVEQSIEAANIFVGSTAKVLLSQSDNDELLKIMEIIKLDKLTERTVTDKKRFLEQVLQARRQGYAVSYGEKLPEVLGIAAPIKNYYIPAALSILGPEYRLKEKVDSLVKELVDSANRISNNLTTFLR